MKKSYAELNSIKNSDDDILNKLVSTCSQLINLNLDIIMYILSQITYFLFIEPKIFLFPHIPVFGVGNLSPSSKRYEEVNIGVIYSTYILAFGTIIFLPILMIFLIIKYHKKDFIINS